MGDHAGWAVIPVATAPPVSAAPVPCRLPGYPDPFFSFSAPPLLFLYPQHTLTRYRKLRRNKKPAEKRGSETKQIIYYALQKRMGRRQRNPRRHAEERLRAVFPADVRTQHPLPQQHRVRRDKSHLPEDGSPPQGGPSKEHRTVAQKEYDKTYNQLMVRKQRGKISRGE